MKKFIPLFFIIFIGFNLFSQKQIIDSIPFTLKTKVLTFKGKINGIETNFAFDTGATIGVLTSKQADNSKIQSTKNKKVTDSNQQKTSMEQTTIDEITIGSFTINDSKSVVYDMPFLACNENFLLGGNVINQLNWKFDFDKKLVYVSKDAFSASSEMISFPVKFKSERHFTDFSLDNKTFSNCLIDFGYTGIFEISEEDKIIKNIEKENKQSSKTVFGEKYTMGLSSGTTSNYAAFTVESFAIGSKNFKNLQVQTKLVTDKKIGLKFFTNYCSQVIINSGEKKYYLKLSNKNIDNDLGLEADYYWKNNKLTVVGKLKNTQNTSDNLQVNEEIKTVNGKKATDFTDECEFIKWKVENSDLQEITIVKMDDTVLIIKRQSLN